VTKKKTPPTPHRGGNKTHKGEKKPPRNPRLPGMEDSGIVELERTAESYAEVRDQRMSLGKREGELNAELLALMKKHGKTEYHHEDVHCWLKVTAEKVKVKIGELQTDFEPDGE